METAKGLSAEEVNRLLLEKVDKLTSDVQVMKTSIQFMQNLYTIPKAKRRSKRKSEDELIQEILLDFDKRKTKRSPR